MVGGVQEKGLMVVCRSHKAAVRTGGCTESPRVHGAAERMASSGPREASGPLSKVTAPQSPVGDGERWGKHILLFPVWGCHFLTWLELVGLCRSQKIEPAG